MGSHKNRFCIYSGEDASEYTKTGARPNCLAHEHVSKDVALELMSTLLYTQNMPNGSVKSFFEYDRILRTQLDSNHRPINAIVCTDCRTWAIRRSGGFSGMEVHQLVRVGR